MPTNHHLRAAGSARWALVILLMAVLTVVHTWPLSSQLSTHLIADPDFTTGSWSLIGMATQLTRDPRALFGGNNLYPSNRTLAVVDHQMTSAALAAPMLAAGAGQVLTTNLSLLLGFLLSGLFMCLLVQRLSGSLISGVVAGCAFAWSAYRVVELGHPHMTVTQWIPLALLALHRFMARPDLRRAGMLTAASLLVALSSLHIAQLGGLAIGLVALFLLAACAEGRLRRLAGLVVAGGVSLVALLPIVRIYSEVAARWPPPTGNGRETLGSLVDMSLRGVDFIAPPGPSTAPYAALLPDPQSVGAFPGVVTLGLAGSVLLGVGFGVGSAVRLPRAVRALLSVVLASALLALLAGAIATIRGDGGALAGLARITAPVAICAGALLLLMLAIARQAGSERASERVVVVAYTALAVTGAFLALGPRVLVSGVDIGSGLARYDLLPIQLMIRAPWRFMLLMAVGLSVLAGLGTARLLRHRRGIGRALLALALLVALNVELGATLPPLIEVPPPTAVDRWLAAEAGPGAVVEYPLEKNYWAIHRSYAYDRRVVNGPGYLGPSALRQMEALPDLSPDQIEMLLRHFRPRYVVVRSGQYPQAARAAVAAAESAGGSLRRRFRGEGEVVYELMDRGRAPALVREWPGHQLRSSEGVFAFEARVTEGPEDTVPELAVLFNGQELLHKSGEEVTRWSELSIAIDTEEVVDGINVLELRAGYRFDIGRPPLAVGTTGVEIPADVLIESDSGRSLIEVNGRQFFGWYGYLIVALDPVTAEVVGEGRFDTYGSETAADGMAYFLDQLPPGTVVLVATRNDAGERLHEGAVRALRDAGLAVDLRGQSGRAHAAVGVRGAPPGSALEQEAAGTATIVLGSPARRRVQLRGLELR